MAITEKNNAKPTTLTRTSLALRFGVKRSTLMIVISVVTIWLIGLMIAIYSSEDILTESSLARSYVDAITWWWPLVIQYAQKSQYPQVALLYNSIVWLALPLLVVLVWRYLKTRKTGLLVKQKLTIIEYLLLIFGCLFYAAIGIVFLVFWNGTNVRLVDFATSRQSLGIWGMSIPLGAAVFLTPIVACVKKIVTGKF